MTTAPALVADIGGTNTRVALADGTQLRDGSVRRFANVEYPGLEAVLQAYLAALAPGTLSGVCVAIAGPVEQGRGRLTNRNWLITPEPLSALAGGARALVLNDLQAQGFALNLLPDTALRPLITAPVQPGAPRLVVGVGTGFNIAPVFTSGDQVIVGAAEAGHQALPVKDAFDLALSDALSAETGFAAVEELLSGRGLGAAYRFVAAQHGADRPADGTEVTRLLNNGAGDPIATQTMAVFASYLGRVASDLALCYLPHGGVYLCGGMARIVAPYLDDGGFVAAFQEKGRFTDFMKNFPVYLIEDDYAALSGCAARLLQDA